MIGGINSSLEGGALGAGDVDVISVSESLFSFVYFGFSLDGGRRNYLLAIIFNQTEASQTGVSS